MVFNGLKRFINRSLETYLGVEIKRIRPQRTKMISVGGKKWNYSETDGFWIGGRFHVSNISKGYHGLLKQWWEFYNNGDMCLLVSENNVVKREFMQSYPGWQFVTLDLYDNKGEPVDIIADLCGQLPEQLLNKFDLVVCQATLEHLYDPLVAMRNIFRLLKVEGIVVIHTHTPVFPYHPFPRDYLRYNPDWFEDIVVYLKEVRLLELFTTKGGHLFAAYRKEKYV
jgi:SAM-dependent methyltransferase